MVALPHLRKVDLSACKLGVQGCMAVARALKDRDGAYVELEDNCIIGSTAGDELCSMPRLNVQLSRPVYSLQGAASLPLRALT